MNFSDKYYEYIEKYKDAHTEGIYTRGSRNPNDKTPLRAISPKVTMVGFGPERWSGFLAENTIMSRMLGGERYNNSVLDYGSGKPTDWYFTTTVENSPSRVNKSDAKQDFLYPVGQTDFLDFIGINKDDVYRWDPAIKGIDHPLPNGAQWDQVWCLDVLEHVPEGDVDLVLDDLFSRTRVALSIVISTSPGKQLFRADKFKFNYTDLKEKGEDLYNLDDISDEERSHLKGGDDLHCTVRSDQWWAKKFNEAIKRNWDKSECRMFRACIKTGPDEKGLTMMREIRHIGTNNVGLTVNKLPKLNRKTWWMEYDKVLVKTRMPYKTKYPKFKEEKWPKSPPKRGHANMIFWKKTNMKEHEEDKKKSSKSGEWKKSVNMVKRPRPIGADGTPK